MNVYMKNYGLWLGGALALGLLIQLGGIRIPLIGMYLGWILVLGGTIAGTVMTHKELGKNIQFGKAIGPVLLLIGGVALLSFIISIIQWGTSGLEYYVPAFLVEVFTEMSLGISILLAAGTWYMFEKAGQPGWAFIVPIYNLIIMCDIAKKPRWWVAMFFVPIANIVFLIMMLNGIAMSFGKSSGFTVGLVFLRQIFFAILGYGDAVYGGTKPQNEEVLDNF